MDFIHIHIPFRNQDQVSIRNPECIPRKFFYFSSDALSRTWILRILCLIFVSVDCFSPLPSHLPRSIAPSSFLVALSRTLCTRANLDCFRCSVLDSPLLPPSSSLIDIPFFSQIRFHWVHFRPSVVVVAISLGPISRRGDRETTRHVENVCVCVCVCVGESRGIRVNLDHESRSCIFEIDNDEMEDESLKIDRSDCFANITISKEEGCKKNNL